MTEIFNIQKVCTEDYKNVQVRRHRGFFLDVVIARLLRLNLGNLGLIKVF